MAAAKRRLSFEEVGAADAAYPTLSLLFRDIARHDLVRATACLRDGTSPNVTSELPERWTALQAAIAEVENGGSIEMVSLLLAHGADPNAWDGHGHVTALLLSLFRGQREATEMLLAAGADTNVTDAEGDSPLRWCVERGDAPMVRKLLAHGAARTIDASGGPSGMSALGRAASRLDLEMVELLLAAGASAAAPDADRHPAAERLPARTAENGARHDTVSPLLAPRHGD